MRNHRFKIKLLLAASLTICLGAAAGCNLFKNRAERLLDLKHEYRERMDKLYDQFGGGEVDDAVEDGIKKATGPNERPNPFLQGLGQFVGEIDRNVFENRAIEIGAGERPILISKKSKDFFLRPVIVEQCKELYLLGLKIETLEEEQAAESDKSGAGSSEKK